MTQHDREHVVLERGLVGETWRSQRWDGFFLNTPNSTLLLPGCEYSGDEPDAFLPLADVIGHLEGYARSFEAPLRKRTDVTSLRPVNGRYAVETVEGTLETDNVVVTTGAFQLPRPRVAGVEAAPVELQLTTSEYRRPEQLPDGAVLVVGGGQSGCQITDELLRAGRDVYLAVGRCPSFPRRYRGRGARALFCAGVEEALAAGDQFASERMSDVDRYIDEHAIDAPAAEPRDGGPSPIADTRELDFHEAGIESILWATGSAPTTRGSSSRSRTSTGGPSSAAA